MDSAVSPMAKTFGRPGTDRSAPTLRRPALSASAFSHFEAGEATTPAAHSTVRAGMRAPLTVTPSSSMRSTRLFSRTSHAEPLQRVLRLFRQRLGEGRQDARRGLHQDYLGLCRIEMAELLLHAEACQLRDGARQLDTGRTSTHDQERQQAAALQLVLGGFGPLECGQHAPAHLGGILDPLQPRGIRPPFVAAEVTVRGTGGEHEVVVRQSALAHHDLAPFGVHARHFAEQHVGVEMLAEQPADRRRDVARRQPGGGHLIEQRLEQVIVVAVDQRHSHAGRCQARGTCESAEPCADDDDSRQAVQREGRLARELREHALERSL